MLDENEFLITLYFNGNLEFGIIPEIRKQYCVFIILVNVDSFYSIWKKFSRLSRLLPTFLFLLSFSPILFETFRKTFLEDLEFLAYR